ncbi:MAG: cytochrome-c peroxidase [Rhodocyclaceae bacterium]|nr:cytochrome-c peroxidase [Rhodocyclaceae bacterium]
MNPFKKMEPGLWLRQGRIGAVWLVIALAGWWFYPAATPLKAEAAPARPFSDPGATLAALPDIGLLGLNPERVALGKRLFHDPRLSADNSIACASCHDLGKGGADPRPVSLGVAGHPGVINSPSVYNSGFNFSQFWDGRAATLEDQVNGPIASQTEFASDWPSIMKKLGHDGDLSTAFRKAYADGLTPANVRHAIAEFERSLVTPSRFDRFLKGDGKALNETEQHGYALFRRYGCAACHQGINIGGNLYQRLGVVKDYFQGKTVKPADLGRYNVTHDPEDRYVFKVPSLRNVALTAPYFHDASAATLEEAVAVMARYQLGVELPPEDRADLVAFLKTLTGEGMGS